MYRFRLFTLFVVTSSIAIGIGTYLNWTWEERVAVEVQSRGGSVTFWPANRCEDDCKYLVMANRRRIECVSFGCRSVGTGFGRGTMVVREYARYTDEDVRLLSGLSCFRRIRLKPYCNY